MNFLELCKAGYKPTLRNLAHCASRHMRHNKSIIMRIQLTVFIISFTCLSVGARVNGQSVTMKIKDASLTTAFAEIKRQTGYHFWYEDDLLKDRKKVSLTLKGASLSEALDACLKDQPFEYTINDKTVVVKQKKTTLLQRLIDKLTRIQVSGKVLGENGAPLAGASIRIKGSSRATQTAADGSFTLPDVDEGAVLQISYLGYIMQELPAAKSMVIRLLTEEGNLEEVKINAGYYTVTDRERTGSISRVDAKTIEQQPVSNPLATLIGRMAGVNIEQQSGLNGGGFKVEIRGRNSLRSDFTDNGNAPLILVDGVPFPATSLTNSSLGVIGISNLSSPLNSLSPTDIASVEVLKDADATAIYGSRGANGVLLITTKRPRVDLATTNVSFSQGFSQIGVHRKLLNTAQFLEVRTEAFKNDGVNPATTDYDVNGTWDKDRYTDWQDVLIGGTARNTNAQISLSGGGALTQFSFRGNYQHNGTVIPGDFNEQKATGSLAIYHVSTNDKFKVNLNATYGIDRNNLSTFDLARFIFLAPNAPALFDSNGQLNWELNSSGAATWENPLANIYNPYTGKTYNFLSNSNFNYEILKNLNFHGNLGYTNIQLNENKHTQIRSQAPSTTARGTNYRSMTSLETWIMEPQLNFKQQFNQSRFEVLAGATFQLENQNRNYLIGSNYTTDIILTNLSAAPTKTLDATSSQYRYNAVFGRLNYNYRETYILNITARRDGSSRFGPDRQFGNFGAVGVAYMLSNESIVKRNLSFVSFAKVRGSYGITGSDQIANYGYLGSYLSTPTYQDQSGLFPTRIANPEYSWETNRKLEAALDLRLFSDRLSMSASWYRNTSGNQLVGYPLPDYIGFSSVQSNLPAKVLNTGWEFELGSSNIIGKSISWKTNFNLSIPRNKLLSYPNLAGSTYANTYTVGESLFMPRSYSFVGINVKTGVYDFVDVDGNGAFNTSDRISAGKSLTSHLTCGLNNGFSFKNFQLDVFFQLVKKTAGYPFTSPPGGKSNQPIEVLQRWQKDGDLMPYQKYSQSTVANGAAQRFTLLLSSNHFVDASFIRLKNISLSWNLSDFMVKKLKSRNVRMFLSGQNILTLTKYPGDPEVSNQLAMPTLRTMVIGLQASL